VFPLTNPYMLQLGTVGSRATVNYGTDITLEAPGISDRTYVDIANFDCYNMIIGTPFMNKNKVILDFENKQVTVNGRLMPAMRYCRPKGKSREFGITKVDHPQLQWQWHDEFSDIFGGAQDRLPSWREVNHEIHLIDNNNKQYSYHLPRVLHTLHEQFHEKINCYMKAGCWEPWSVSQAAMMLCVSKKDGKLWTVMDAQQCNENAIKDVTPLPDQDMICKDIAQAKIHSKVNLSNRYEQV
ncbi:hypothetical protein L208DRAFT_1281914, partial [Tricholoma matsutake]